MTIVIVITDEIREKQAVFCFQIEFSFHTAGGVSLNLQNPEIKVYSYNLWSFCPLVDLLLFSSYQWLGKNWVEKTGKRDESNSQSYLWEQPIPESHHFLWAERQDTSALWPLSLSLLFSDGVKKNQTFFFSLSLGFCMHNNNMWYCWNNCPLSILGANSPKVWLRHLNSRAAGFVGIFLTWVLSWSSHWCSLEQEQVLRQPYADFKSRNSSLLLINHSDFFAEFIYLQISITIRYFHSHWNKWRTPLWETPFRFTEVAKKIKIIIKISFLVYFLFPSSYFFSLLMLVWKLIFVHG